MSLETLFDTTVRIWRPVRTRGAKLKDERRTHEPVGPYPTAPNACVNRVKAPIVPVGAGLAAEGERRFYMGPDTDVEERDVLQIVAGPDAVGTFEVDNPPTRPRGHHVQLDTRVWRGELPAEPS